MPTQSSPVPDFHQAVATEFASRPSVREVLGRQILQLLAAHHASLKAARLTDAELLILNIPVDNSSASEPSYEAWTPRPLLDLMLQAWLEGTRLQSMGLAGGDFLLAVKAPGFLVDQQGSPMPFAVVSVRGQLDALDDLLVTLADDFCQAQIDYWQASGSQGVSRDRYLQHLLKAALLHNLPLQGLDDQQSACVLDLLTGSGVSPSVFAVRALLDEGTNAQALWLPNLLVRAEWDEREVILWCAPGSVIRAFSSMDVFAVALRDELAEHHSFVTMSWDRYELDGDVFAQQSTLMLENMLDSIQRLQGTRLQGSAVLEQACAALSDPSGWFIEGYGQASDAQIALPPGLWSASPRNSFACQQGAFELALAQAQSHGVGALDDVLDLHSYTRQALRTQMLADFPDDANYHADDLVLQLAVSVGTPGGAGVGPSDGAIERRSLSLTEFAIANLSSLQGAQIVGVTHREGQLIMDWMNGEYLKRLVQQVDIGYRYPTYVAQKLDDPLTEPERVTRFAREWRCSLLFSALRERLGGTLSDAGLQCVTDYCHRDVDADLPAVILMPLAFRREPGATELDQVSGMYVLFATEPARVLLYRPLYPSAALLEYASLDLLMEAIGSPGPLQTSVLDWLTPEARAVYDHGGFSEPHLSRPIIDTQLLPERPAAAAFAAQFWREDVDLKMYRANRDVLVALAERQSVSNAESRWAILLEGAWLLFDVVTLLLRGPVATVAWLVQAIGGLQNDVTALRDGSEFERSSAVVDLLLNASMALLHLRLPRQPSGAAPRPERYATSFAASGAAALPAPRTGQVEMTGALAAHPGTQLDFSWRGAQGFNVLTPEQRKVLSSLRSAQSLDGQQVIESGAERGLYRIAGQHYVPLADGVYAVELFEDDVRVVGTDGAIGPWLTFEHGQWRVDRALRLRGGMPKSRLQALKEENRRQVEQLMQQEVGFARKHNLLADTLNRHRDLFNEKEARIKALEALAEPDELTRRELDLTRRLHKQIRLKVIYEIKDVIDNALEHERVVNSLFNMRHEDARLAATLKDQRSRVRQSLIENMSTFYNELASVINDKDLDALADQIVIHPERESEISLYRQFRTELEQVITWESDLVEMSRLLDSILDDTLKDDTFVFISDETNERINKDVELRETIKSRRVTAIDLDFRLLQDLAEASLNRLANVEERVLAQYFDYLASDSLKSAGNAHGDLASSELSLAEQIEVLSGILEGYEEAAAMADYLTSLGGAAINSDYLQRYKQTLQGLQRAAQGDMAQAVREQELAEPRPVRPAYYAPRGGRRKLVRTTRGRRVLAEEVELDGVAVIQQRDQRTQHVLKTFHQHEGEWVEAVPAPDPAPPFSPLEPRLARKRAQALLDEIERIKKLAKSFFQAEQPNGLATVVDDHLEKLRSAQSSLPRTSPDDALLESLGEAIDSLEANRRDLLTGLYLSTTHPDANSLRFLFDNQQVTVHRAGERKALSANDYLDVYEIRRLPRAGQVQGDGLWEAHLHYPEASTERRHFSKGHLKLWAQRKLGRLAQLRAATTGADLLAIYRGEVRLAQVEGIIPFD